ncbi:delta-1-pyrroline-5-carboxylate synthase-like [Humulus lupulus]|uniref:delta-1-pyrroline-5-carboxylate synthase-like n=1 Tax=Humulus lupulus TaxID=3486 RepID=UPI002B415820|nr:delta-1-pyrroline-5-carboxylate synthase-like [Humulus lupulus]
MDSMDPTRAFVKNVKRLVVKVGTAVVTRGDGRLALGRLGALCEQLKELNSQDYEVILVTSGAVGLGRQRLRYRRLANTSFADLQYLQGELDDGKACAAVGQGSLMALYDTMFSQLDVTSSQLLVTDGVFRDRAFKKQLSDTVNSLVSLKVIPIFNENDAVSTRREPLVDSSGIFWDNDSLAGLLAQELKADLLVLLSDVEGLYSGPPNDPKSKLIHTYVKEKHQDEITFGDKSRLGRGGMTAKVNAAVSAADAGIPVVITSGYAADNIIKVLQGKRIGTVFHQDAPLWPVVKEVCAREMALAARECSTRLQALGSKERRQILLDIADSLEAKENLIKAENQADIAAAIEAGKDKTVLSRLTLKPGKISSLARSVRKLADMEEPIGQVSGRSELADGVVLEKVSCPLGVLLVVFESRPDALVQIASLAIRTGNGLLLKGESDAKRSNAIFHKVITSAIPTVVGDDLIGLVTSREEIPDLLKLEDVIDLVIPRGNKNLVSQIKESTKIPVLGHADGICHVYIDKSANLDMARSIVLDAKINYPDTSNTVKKLLVHKGLSSSGKLSELMAELQIKGVSLYGGPKASTLFSIAELSPFHLEYNKMACTVEIVEDIYAAIDHIHQNGSSHSDSIVAEDKEAAEIFLDKVDSAGLCHNGSRVSCNGGSSEIDNKVEINSNGVHIRDPVGVEGLLTTQWVMRGNGKVASGHKAISHTQKQLTMLA